MSETGPVTTLREGFRGESVFSRSFRCLEVCARRLREADPQARVMVVEALARHLGAAEVVWLGYREAGFETLAANGSVLGVGTRLVPRPTVQALLRGIGEVVCRPAPATNWLLTAQQPGFEWLIPLALQGRVVGLLAVAGFPEQPPPTAEDQRMVDVLGTLLAAVTVETQGNSRLGRPASAAEQEDLSRLTARERQILSLLPRGFSNARIGISLDIAPGTVKTHVERILGKLQLDDRAQAAARAVELGLGHSGVEL